MSNNLENLNSEQQQAVIHDDGPLLIVAGAGTGKTTVITQRISYLINEKKCRPEEILALTFTDKAAGEMEERVDRLLPYGYVDLWISTFHAFAERILKDHGLEIGLPNDFKLLSATQQWLIVRQNLDKFNLDYYRPLGNPTKFIHALIKHFSRAKDENISAQDYLKYVEDLKMNSDSAEYVRTIIDEETANQLSKKELKEVLAHEILKQEEVANAYHIYQQLLLDNNALDFGDLINYCLKLFSERKNLLAKYRSQFKYILVDEFQDVNYAQYELVKIIGAPKNNITVVGDDDQSIYRFRGASIANILQFKDDYPNLKEIFLTANYRSRQNILDLSYKFIQQNNPYRLEVKLAKDKKLCKVLRAEQEGIAEISHLHGHALADEVKITVEKIIELYNKSKNTNWSDFAILVRANASANNFIYALERADIPYNFVASRGLYAKNVVLDILAYLKLLDNYHESSAMYRILSLPIWGFDARDIINLNYWSKRKGWSVYESMKQTAILNNISHEGKKRFEQILGLIDRHGQMIRENKNTTEIIQAFLIDTGYLKNLTAIDNQIHREQLNYLNQFYKKVQEFELETDEKGVRNFLALIGLELESGEEGTLKQNLEEEGPDAVKIMTVHAAKGLEFKYVFIVNLVDKKFPSVSQSEPIELPEKLIKEITAEGDIHLQEERRLFYVGMTRAKEGLYFTSADDYGGNRKKKLSRFLIELSEAGLELSSSESPLPFTRGGLGRGLVGEDKLDTPNKKKEIIENLLPATFSFSQIRAFESCPYQYRFAYILKVPTKGNPQFSFGKTIHSTLQKYFQLANLRKMSRQKNLFGDETASKIPTGEELLKIYETSFIDDWYPDRKTKEQYFEKGKKALKEFYEKHKDNLPEVKFLEYPFNLKIKNDAVYAFFGVIDRVDKTNEGIRIVDYKTGRVKNKLEPEDKEQLLIYQLAAQEVMKEKVKELIFYYIEENKEMAFLGTDKELDKLKKKIIAIIEEIKKGSFPPKPGNICQWCDFNSICEFKG
ncbi:MAG: UvrD-helicase domain-containing protein [Patescibacteria group bacterium]